MSTLRAYLGTAGLVDIGYRLYTQNTPVAARQTTSIVDEGAGWYSVTGVTLAGDHVRWDSTGTATAIAREDLIEREILEVLDPNLLQGASQILLVELYVPTGQPAVIVPGAPADVGLCRIYGYFEHLDNALAAGIQISFTLTEPGPVKTERIISGRTINATTDGQGRLVNGQGDPWLDLQRNDMITPSGTTYFLNSDKLGFKKREITLNSSTFDLATLIT